MEGKPVVKDEWISVRFWPWIPRSLQFPILCSFNFDLKYSFLIFERSSTVHICTKDENLWNCLKIKFRCEVCMRLTQKYLLIFMFNFFLRSTSLIDPRINKKRRTDDFRVTLTFLVMVLKHGPHPTSYWLYTFSLLGTVSLRLTWWQRGPAWLIQKS